jgi:dTMP kinase
LRRANAAATGGLEPDLTLYVDIDPRLGLTRKHDEGATVQTGTEELAFHERVRAGYRTLATEAGDRWATLDGSQPATRVEAAAWAVLEPVLKR